MDIRDLHRRAVDTFASSVARIGDDDWARSTPCEAWNVRDLVNHVVAEELWTGPLLAGETVASVGSRFDGDVLGSEPRRTAAEAASSAAAAADAVDLEAVVHLSFGDFPADFYLEQLLADHVIHCWDLEASLGTPFTVADELVQHCEAWFGAHEDAYRAASAISDRPMADLPTAATARLLARFGRSIDWRPNDPSTALSVVRAFNDAVNRHDLDAVRGFFAPDARFESTGGRDGESFVGRDSIMRFWEGFFAANPAARFESEEEIEAGNRVVVRWRYHWSDTESVRGIDLFKVGADGIEEKFAYVKG